MHISDVQQAKPHLLIDAGDAWDALATTFSGRVKDCGKYLHQRLGQHWNGGLGAENAADRLGRMQRDLGVAKQELDLVGDVLRDAGEIFMALQSRLKNLIAEAKEAGFTVHGDGSVSGPAFDTKGMTEAEVDKKEKARDKRAQGFADDIGGVLKDAAEADKTAVETIKVFTDAANRCAKGDWYVGILETASASGYDDEVLRDAGMPDKKASPAKVAAWWKGLSPELREELLEDHPVILGNRDGIPATDRDHANRAYLPHLLNQLERDHDRASGDEAEAIQAKIDGLKGIQQKLGEKSDPPMFLLGMGDQGNGRAIVSYGNPDTAKNVSAYVPGLNTRLDGHFASADVKRAQDVAIAAQQASPNSPTASIVWLGYDAPQLKEVSPSALDVMSKDDAQKGAPAYDNFLRGVRATHEGGAPHVTAVGHSYGSLTVGQASQQPGGIPADDVVLVGSPGTGVDKAKDFGVGADHVYVGAAANDQVTKLPPKNPLEYMAPGSEFGTKKIWFGTDPASRDFGGHHFAVAPGEDTGLMGLLSGDLPAHSLYFDPDKGGDSLQNIAKVVTGHGDKIEQAKPR
ncbi:alpha/beta hydrolase [Streptomyces varsoviensis]|uniref:alpha/beta hydrolase n=1 Tax=Streptomyces varsoviensis TaxID=67373 RepID=UPI0033F87701